jgi:hypothetical protein
MSSSHYSCQNLTKPEFSLNIFENTQISNFIKIRPVAAMLFHVGRVTDITKLTVAFRSFAYAPKN